MGQIGFSVTYKDEFQARKALRSLENNKIPITHAKLFIRDNQSDTSFFDRLKPKIFLLMLRNGLLGGVIGAMVFILLWLGWSVFFDQLEFWKIITLGAINGGSTGLFLGTALSVINKEDLVPISIEDINNESIVLDFSVDGSERERVESILQKSGADKILED